MNEWKVEEVLSALLESGKIALRFYDAPDARLKSDSSLVTAADHAIEHELQQIFEDVENGSFLIGEETVDSKSKAYLDEAFRKTAWIVDPIDGTAPYAHHLPTWGISIARMEDGVITDGGVYLPTTGEVFITSDKGILFAAGAGDATVSDLEPLSIVKRAPDISDMIAVTQSVVKRGSFSLKNPVQAMACAVFPLTYLLLGRISGYMGTLKLWDIAGCLALLHRAGFVCVLQEGGDLGPEVTNDIYHLEPDDPRRWFIRSRVFCGASREMIDYLLEGVS
ncbi:MAG: inositol monophosphatase family protein [Spirochaetales bacterium]|nr:inositol monophosphatase family protein [Spirochaetales bacterium]